MITCLPVSQDGRQHTLSLKLAQSTSPVDHSLCPTSEPETPRTRKGAPKAQEPRPPRRRKPARPSPRGAEPAWSLAACPTRFVGALTECVPSDRGLTLNHPPPRPALSSSALPVPLGRGCGRSVRGLLRLLRFKLPKRPPHPDGPRSRLRATPARPAGPEPFRPGLNPAPPPPALGPGQPSPSDPVLPLPARLLAPPRPAPPDLICAITPGPGAGGRPTGNFGRGGASCPEG